MQAAKILTGSLHNVAHEVLQLFCGEHNTGWQTQRNFNQCPFLQLARAKESSSFLYIIVLDWRIHLSLSDNSSFELCTLSTVFSPGGTVSTPSCEV